MAKTRRGSSARTSAKSSASSLPRVTRALVAQDESRRILEAVLSPWRVTRWEANDFGIDGVVEITSPVANTADNEATGAMFAVQLKATDADDAPTSLDVSPGKLRYWLNHSLPVVLVSTHLRSSTMRARWIDAALLSEIRERSPTFWDQKTLSISLPLGLTAAALTEIEVHVIRFRRRELAVPPSRFFDIRDQVLALADEIGLAGLSSGVKTVELLVDHTRKTLKAGAYRIAVAGPARVGKSTLVNAFLGLDVSPIADYPTTAVPLLFEAGDVSRADVHFANQASVSVEASSASLRPFAAQQENDENDKGVSAIRVTLPNKYLSRGVSLVDTPGLHDASEVVRHVTEAALQEADAVLYVLDASLGAKFKLGQSEVEDLQVLQSSKERLLIVMNQVDGLSEIQREPLATYLEKQLRKYNIWSGLPLPPLYVSGKLAWDARSSGMRPPPEFVSLEDEVWGHLLRSRSTGMDRLLAGVGALHEATSRAIGLLSERTVMGAQSTELEKARQTCGIAIKKCATLERDAERSLSETAETFFADRAGQRLAALEAELKGIDARANMPTTEALRDRLQQAILADGTTLWQYANTELPKLSEALSDLVRKALDDSSAQLGLPKVVSVLVPHFPPLPPVDLSLPEAGHGLLGGLLGFLVNPVVGLATTLIGWLTGLDLARQRRRARLVRDLTARYKKALDDGYQLLLGQVRERVSSIMDSLSRQARGRLETFVDDATRRIDRLGTPLSATEASRLKGIADALGVIQGKLNVLAEVLAKTTA